MKPISEDFKYILTIIGDNLRQVRTARKQCLQTVSDALEISQGRLGDIENGEYDMELGFLIDLCRYYQVKAADVICEDFKYSVE